MQGLGIGSKLRLAASAFLLIQTISAAANTTEELNRAARNGDIEIVRTLLAQNADPNSEGPGSRTPLFYAALFNRNEVASLLLAHHADPNSVASREAVEFPQTPLQIAASMGNVSMASMLVSAGARIDATTVDGRTALHFAAVGLHPEMVRFLVEEGSNVNASDKDGVHPLDDTVWRGFLEETIFLVNHGARPDQPVLKTGATPLNEAAFTGQTPTLRYLLTLKPDLETKDRSGYTPLENAVRMRHQDSALLLLEAKPYSSYVDSLQRVVSVAIGKDDALVVGELIEQGLNPNSNLPNGATLLTSAAFTGASDTVSLLLSAKADPNRTAPDGTMPLEEACLKGSVSIAKMLVDSGAGIDTASAESKATPLYIAASFGHTDVVKFLLERQAQPNFCGANRVTPLHVAESNGNTEIAALLIRHGGGNICQN